MSWSARTFADALKDADVGGRGRMPDMKRVRPEELPPNLRLRSGEGRVKGRVDFQCPSCGLMVQAFRLTDVSALPVEITSGHQFVCDGCRTRWQREGKLDIDELAERLGAPRAHVERIREWKAARRTANRRYAGGLRSGGRLPIPDQGVHPPRGNNQGGGIPQP